HVMSDSGSAPALAADRMRVAARVVDGDREVRIGNTNPDNGRVKDDWSFTVGGIYAAAHLRVTVPEGWAVQAIQDRDGRDVSDDAIDLRNGEELSGVRVIVTDKVTTVSGQLSDEKGQTVTDGAVI